MGLSPTGLYTLRWTHCQTPMSHCNCYNTIYTSYYKRKAKGNTVTVTYTKSADATGYDVVLGSSVKSVNGEKRPVDFGELVKKNVKGNTVTVTFKNVPAGTYYAGLHSFNRTSEDGKKIFSKWSNAKKVTVK